MRISDWSSDVCSSDLMVWYWAGPDFLVDAPTDYGLLWGWGALDFAGGTVVHINAGIAGLVGAIMVGKRVGFPKEPMRSEEHTSELQSLMRISYAVFCLKKKNIH